MIKLQTNYLLEPEILFLSDTNKESIFNKGNQFQLMLCSESNFKTNLLGIQ